MSSQGAPWADSISRELDACSAHAKELAEGLSLSQLNWQPAPGAWSIGECLDHLLAANRVYLPPIDRALEGRSRSPVEKIVPGWFGRWFIRRVIDPSTATARYQAPKQIKPAEKIDPSVLAAFLESNRAARALVRRAGDYDVNKIRFRNPFVPLIRFTVGTGLEIIWRHQKRHLLQAERVHSAHDFPSS